MRLSLSVNGDHNLIASIAGPGYLNAHLNMHDRPKEGDRSQIVRIVGTDTSSEAENIRLEWPAVDLKIGDTVELRVLREGEGDAPSEIRRSSEAPSNLFTNTELARELLQLVSDFDAGLLQLLARSEKVEPLDEHKRVRTAVGHVITELGHLLLYPIYRRHKELVPEEMKGELL